MSKLFSPFQLGPVQLPNRIVIAPMCQYSADNGQMGDWHQIHLGGLALSGAGLLIIEASAVEPIGRISPADVGLWDDATEAAMTRVLKSVRRHSAMPVAIQLAHAGRKASSQAPWDGGQLLNEAEGGWQTVAPSALPHLPQEPAPQALDQAGIRRIKEAFVAAAVRAERMGIDVIELHMAHGYLLHQFLSPLANQRDDQYGGSLDNRMRFPLEVFHAVKAALPEGYPVGVRISATDWVEGGWDPASSIVLSQRLEAAGCAFIHVSSGGVSPLQKIVLEPGYQVGLATQIKAAVKMPVIAVGLITEAEQAEAILQADQADLIGIARGILYDPHWPWHAAAKLGASVAAPKQYWRSQPRDQKNLFGEVKIGAR